MSDSYGRTCSSDESFVYIDFPPPQPAAMMSPDSPVSQRTKPLTSDQHHDYMDEDGRLVQEHAFRKAVFLGGIDPAMRRQMWQFLFGLYPCTSTAREREILLLDSIVKYHELKSCWKSKLVQTSDSSSPLEQGLVAKYQFKDDDPHNLLPSPDLLKNVERTFTSSLDEEPSLSEPDTSVDGTTKTDDSRITSIEFNHKNLQSDSQSGALSNVDSTQFDSRTSSTSTLIDNVTYCSLGDKGAHLESECASIHPFSDLDIPYLEYKRLGGKHFDVDLSTPEIRQQVDFMKIQAQVNADRQKFDTNNIKTYIRIIDKDVPRTDRDYKYFSGSGNPHLTELREILITFVACLPDVGYAQGMNDILARFLVVFDSEVEAFWCFKNYIENIKNDFLEEGMVRKIDLVRMLLGELDPELMAYLTHCDLGDLMFCHRWLLLGFKREFPFDDSLRCFEILSSHYLELSSMEADKARLKEERKEFQTHGGTLRTAQPYSQTEYTFELFMCVALLIEERITLFQCTDAAMVFQCINNLEINLDEILTKTESLFYRYCKKSVEDCFLMVDTAPVKKKEKRKIDIF